MPRRMGLGEDFQLRNGKDATRLAPFGRYLDSLLAPILRGLLPEERRYVFLVPWVGLLGGLLAVALEKLLSCIQWAAWAVWAAPSSSEVSIVEEARRLAGSQPLLVVAVPAAGGALVTLVLCFLRNKERFEGTAALIESLAFRKGYLPLGSTLAEGIVSISAVGAGASLGREGAMISSGAALASWVGRKFRLAEHHVKILLACGAASGMAAAYNAPIGAAIFAMEVLLGSFAIDLFGPIIICTVLSTLVSRRIFGSLPVYSAVSYTLAREWEILFCLALGGLLGLVSVLFIRVFSGLQNLFAWMRPVGGLRPVAAMSLLGAAALFFPELLGNGYDTVNAVLGGSSRLPIALLLVLPALKIFFTALCRTAGVPGGLFTPSLFVGALFGYAFGLGVNYILPGQVSSPGMYGLVGMGAMLSGTLQASITAILMIFELTGDYTFILPLMTASMASAVTSHLLRAGSIYTEQLRRKGIYVPSASAPTWIRQAEVRSVLSPEVATISPTDRFQEIVEKFLRAPEGHEHLYVTQADGVCLGVISLHDIKRFIKESGNLDTVIAADVMTESFPYLYADDPLSRAYELLSEHSFERLPVLDGPSTRRLLGTVSKRRLLISYSESNIPRRQTSTGG